MKTGVWWEKKGKESAAVAQYAGTKWLITSGKALHFNLIKTIWDIGELHGALHRRVRSNEADVHSALICLTHWGCSIHGEHVKKNWFRDRSKTHNYTNYKSPSEKMSISTVKKKNANNGKRQQRGPNIFLETLKTAYAFIWRVMSDGCIIYKK